MFKPSQDRPVMEPGVNQPGNERVVAEFSPAQRGLFANFAQLSFKYREGEDFAVETRDTGSRIGVFAPHGGFVEPCTAEIAEAIAGNELSRYIFRALTEPPSQLMHLTSTRFDDPRALSLAARVETVVTVHGCAEQEHFLCLGGLDVGLKTRAVDALLAAGFVAIEPPRDTLRGINPHNLCNRGRSGKGLQIEISAGLRDVLLATPMLRTHLVATLREAIDS